MLHMHQSIVEMSKRPVFPTQSVTKFSRDGPKLKSTGRAGLSEPRAGARAARRYRDTDYSKVTFIFSLQPQAA